MEAPSPEPFYTPVKSISCSYSSPILLQRYHANFHLLLSLTSPTTILGTCSIAIELSHHSRSSGAYQYQIVIFQALLALMNSLACRVFRILRLLKTGTSIDEDISTVAFRPFTQDETSPTQNSDLE